MAKRYDAAIKAEWAVRWSTLSQQGIKMERVCAEIAANYGCDRLTVRRSLDEKCRARSRADVLRRYHRHRIKLRYERAYRRFTRHPDRYLDHIYVDRAVAHLDEITTLLPQQLGGIAFRSMMIQRVLRQYQTSQLEGRIRGPPWLIEVTNGEWKYDRIGLENC